MKTTLRGTPVRGCSRTESRGEVRGFRVPVQAVATPSRPPASRAPKRSSVETIKQESDFLRHPLMEELVSDAPHINEQAMQLMKFHGSYQQDHREKRAFGQGKFYQFMMRTRQPAGKVHWQLYVVMDDLSDQVSGLGRKLVSFCNRWFGCGSAVISCRLIVWQTGSKDTCSRGNNVLIQWV